MKKPGFNTRVLHTPYTKEDPHGALRMPVYDAAAFEFQNSENIAEVFRGDKLGHVYSRSTNPTVEYFEQVIKNATDAYAVLSFSSGMAALSNLIISLVNPGENVVTTKHLFGNTYSLFDKTLSSLGLEFRFVDLTNLEDIERSIDDKTRLIFLETITNPLLEVADVKEISKLTEKYNILLVADTTITPLCMFNAKEHGADIEIISSTKYISGGATSVGGILIDYGTYNWQHLDKLKEESEKYGQTALMAKLRKEVHRNFGACLSPHNAYLQSVGLESFSLRAERSCSNALKLATWLEKHLKIKAVNYPGLVTSDFHSIAKSQFGSFTGALLTFNLSTKKECFEFLDHLKIIRRATNLNDNKSLAIHPASTIFCEYPEEERKSLGIHDGMIRLAVGIEDIDDIIDDMDRALTEI